MEKNGGPKIAETSPITIGGGGSVGVGFDHQHFVQNTANEYSNARDELDTVLVISRHGKPMHNLLQAVKGQDCRVTVSCKDSGNVDSPITFESRPGGPLKIKFTDADYPFDNAKEVHYNKKDRKLSSLVVLNNATGQTTSYTVDSKGTIVVLDL